ncbi:translation initiation factor IF-2 subunit gamma [Candidatus Woesearchaeota archaeon]|nr:translation initiation factor IF-2 subunit gamma [Candidatus Woesearchaeota archaeon]
MSKKPKPDEKKENFLQPELNIGMVGHVDHGKTTLLETLSGVWADTHSEEIKRGITIRLGYADAIFYKEGDAYTTKPKDISKAKALRKVSFVDAPGHESLMATMLSGATIMDGALLLVAANETCPQPQTREHLMALQIIGIKNIVIAQNKIDLVDENEAIKNYNQIKDFIKKTAYENAPIIPISAQHNAGISNLIKAIEETIITPKSDRSKNPIMFVARSFDINKPGTLPENLVGGVIAGGLKQGILKKEDEIEIRPGRKIIEKNKEIMKPIKTKIIDLRYGGISVDEIYPGGTVGILTSLDPSIVKADQLTGSLVGLPKKLPDTLYEITLEPHLLERVVGTQEELTVQPIKMNEALMLNVNSAATVGIVTSLKKKSVVCKLKIPICTEINSRVTISRRIGNRFRLIGYAEILEGK